MNKQFNITIIGSGNVAFHLGNALYNAGVNIVEVYSKTYKNAYTLSKQLNAKTVRNLNELSNNTDLIIIAVKDDEIINVVKKIQQKNTFIAHTSGSIPISVFDNLGITAYGIFYPLQTFSKEKKININEIPFCLEANTTKNLKLLEQVAKTISNNVYIVDSNQRKILHLAAVFACNFSNHLYSIANSILTKNNLSFDLLKPLIKETANKIEHSLPHQAQTGPAIRKDKQTIDKHIAMLKEDEDYKKIYELITNQIIKQSNG